MFGKSDDLKDMRKWRVWKLKLIDARLYFVSIFVGLLTGLVAVPYHYLLQLFFNTRRDFFDSHPHWYCYFLVLMGNTFVCYVAGEKNAFNHRWGHPSNPWGY